MAGAGGAGHYVPPPAPCLVPFAWRPTLGKWRNGSLALACPWLWHLLTLCLGDNQLGCYPVSNVCSSLLHVPKVYLQSRPARLGTHAPSRAPRAGALPQSVKARPRCRSRNQGVGSSPARQRAAANQRWAPCPRPQQFRAPLHRVPHQAGARGWALACESQARLRGRWSAVEPGVVFVRVGRRLGGRGGFAVLPILGGSLTVHRGHGSCRDGDGRRPVGGNRLTKQACSQIRCRQTQRGKRRSQWEPSPAATAVVSPWTSSCKHTTPSGPSSRLARSPLH